MNLQFIRNIQFTKLLRAGGRQREFNFRKQHLQGGAVFSVDVVNDRGDRIQFYIQKNGSEWKITGHDLPQWVQDSEPGLQQLLEEY